MTETWQREPLCQHERVADVGRLLVCGVTLWLVMCGLGRLLAGPIAGSAVARWDAHADVWFAEHRSAIWDTLTHVGTFAAETVTVITLGVLAAVALRVRLRRWRESVMLAVTVGGEVLIFAATTMLVDRPRPPVVRLDSAPPTSSFPSGHTAAAVALYGGLAVIAAAVPARTWLRRLALVAAVAVPVAVGVSRIYRGMHYPTDVAAGALLGLVWLAVCRWIILDPRRRPTAS